jgi:hypothetical protein
VRGMGEEHEACRLAALVFGVGVLFPIPAQNTPLNRLARLIQSVLLLRAWDGRRAALRPERDRGEYVGLGCAGRQAKRHRVWKSGSLSKSCSASAHQMLPRDSAICRKLASPVKWQKLSKRCTLTSASSKRARLERDRGEYVGLGCAGRQAKRHRVWKSGSL